MQGKSREELLIEFQTLTHEEKYQKIMIYLHAMQKSENNFIGLYSILEELWSENIEESILDEFYATLLDITFIGKDYEESWLDKMASLLQSLKENIIDESGSKAVLDSIDSL